MRSALFLSVFAAAVLGCSRSPQPAPPASAAPLARVGARDILPADLLAEAQFRRENGRPVPGKDALLAEMVEEETLVQRALATGLDRDPATLRAWRSTLVGALKGRRLEPAWQAATVTDEDVAVYFDAHRAEFATPEQDRLAVIFAAVPERAPAEARAAARGRLETLRASLASGSQTFAQAAAAASDHQATRYRGGEVGWIVRGRAPSWLPASVAEAAFSLDEGALSPVLEAPAGCYLVTTLGHRAAGTRPLAEVSPLIRERLEREQRERVEAEFLAACRAAVPRETFPAALDAVDLPSGALADTPAAPPPSPVSTAQH